MALPIEVNETIVFGRVMDFDGNPIENVTVTARPSVTRVVLHSTDHILYPSVENANTDATGLFFMQLMASNDPDLDPTNWSYTFTLSGMGVSDTFSNVTVPYDAPADPDYAFAPAIKLVALVSGGTGEGAPFKLAGLSDVTLTSVADGQLLTYDSVTSKWINADPTAVSTVDWDNITDKPATFTPSTHTHALSALVDVALAALATGQKLRYNGTTWVNVDDNVDNVTGLDTALSGKADVAHAHVVNDVTDIAEVGKTGDYADLVNVPDFDAEYVSIDTPLFKPTLPRLGVEKMIWAGTAGHPFINLGADGVVDVNDTADYAIGSQSIKLSATEASFTDVAAGSGAVTVTDVSGLVPVVWVKVEGVDAITSMRLWLSDSGWSLTNAYVWELKEASDWPFVKDAAGSAPGDGWYKITLPYGKATLNGSAPDLALINAIRFDIIGDGSATCTVHWGGVGFAVQQTEFANGVITLRMDDLYASQFDTVAPILDRYGYAASAFAITQIFREGTGVWTDRMSLSEAHKLEELHGWEVCSHADSSALHGQSTNQGGLGDAAYTAYDSDTQIQDMIACRQYLIDNGFAAPHHFSYPQGAWDEAVRLNVRKLFTTGITFNAPTYETLPVADPTRIRCARITSTTLAEAQGIVDDIKAGKEWGVLAFHDIVTTPTTTDQWAVADFEDLIEYIFAQGVPVRLVSDVVS